MNAPISRQTKRGSNLAKTLVVTVMGVFLASSARAATASFSTDPPTTGSIIISNLTGAYTSGTANAALNSNVDDPWTTNNAASSPYTVTPTESRKFYRVLVQ